jgi:hypothetical protein
MDKYKVTSAISLTAISTPSLLRGITDSGVVLLSSTGNITIGELLTITSTTKYDHAITGSENVMWSDGAGGEYAGEVTLASTLVEQSFISSIYLLSGEKLTLNSIFLTEVAQNARVILDSIFLTEVDNNKQLQISSIFGQVRPAITNYVEWEYILSDTENLIIPCAIPSVSAETAIPYEWDVYIDYNDGIGYQPAGIFIGTATPETQQITVKTAMPAGTYKVKIKPLDRVLGWAKAICWQKADNKNQLTRILADNDDYGFGLSENQLSYAPHFRAYEYDGCVNLQKPVKEEERLTPTTIGEGYREGQYNGCTGLEFDVPEHTIIILKPILKKMSATDALTALQRITAINAGIPKLSPLYVKALETIEEYLSGFWHNSLFPQMLNSSETAYHNIFAVPAGAILAQDVTRMPRHINTDGDLLEVTLQVPTTRKMYVINRTNIENYNTLGDNWK